MCFGPFTRIFHIGPLTALGILKCITGMTVHCSAMWWPFTTWGGFLNVSLFMSLSGLTLFNFLSSLYHGPGYLPVEWVPEREADRQKLQWCSICKGYKAPRSHHCRRCGRCVLKMDHHCPWINNCVGWGNQAHFSAFLTFTVLGCIHASIILGCSLYRALYRMHYMYYQKGPIVYLGLYGTVLCVFTLGLAIGAVIAVGMLLFFQIRAILNNRTCIEDWILEKANHRRQNQSEVFKFPYDLGKLENVKDVVNWSCHPVGDGIHYRVAEGCNQFTLTLEQIAQKSDKRQRTKHYKIIRPVSGFWVPITQGLGVCLHPPCTDEPRIKLEVGDTVLVTRWRKYWLFGEKVQNAVANGHQTVPRIKGWFPRKCAVEIVDCEELTPTNSKKNKKIN